MATNAPGRSAFNIVERKMSKELAELILPHDHVGRHFDGQGRTFDTELEKRNFEFAGRMLAEVWPAVNIDGFPTVSKYILPETSELDDEALLTKDEKLFSDHVKTSQYFLQILKCNNLECCMKPRSSYFSVILVHFLPPPIPLEQSSGGLKAPDRANDETHIFPLLFVSKTIKWDDTTLPESTCSFKVLPYDLYCPSVQSSLLDRTCKVCHIYFSSILMLKAHFVLHKKTPVPQIPKVRPQRIAARRQRELMAIIVSEENGSTDAEWFDEGDLDLNGIEMPTENPDS